MPIAWQGPCSWTVNGEAGWAGCPSCVWQLVGVKGCSSPKRGACGSDLSPSCPQSWTLALQTSPCQAFCSEAPTRSPISLPPTQSGLAMPLPGGLQLQAVTSSPTSSCQGMGKRNRRMRKLKKKKKKKQDRQAGPPPQFLKCSPHHPKSPHGQREGREGISASSIKGL